MRKGRIIPAVLIGKRYDEIAIAHIGALAETVQNLGFDALDDLPVERQIIV